MSKCTVPGGRNRPRPGMFCWAVLVGQDASRLEEVWSPGVPRETDVREMFGIDADIPVLVGCP